MNQYALQLISSNTRDLNADHRETAQLPMAQAASQSVEESSGQWAAQQIAQAQEPLRPHASLCLIVETAPY